MAVKIWKPIRPLDMQAESHNHITISKFGMVRVSHGAMVNMSISYKEGVSVGLQAAFDDELPMPHIFLRVAPSGEGDIAVVCRYTPKYPKWLKGHNSALRREILRRYTGGMPSLDDKISWRLEPSAASSPGGWRMYKISNQPPRR